MKAEGNECKLYSAEKLPTISDCDEAWVTTTFTFDIPVALGIINELKRRGIQEIHVGGVSASLLPELFKQAGLTVHAGLMPGVEEHSPDYTLLASFPGYSIVHTSRGCVRKCGFCMVHKLEPAFYNKNWIKDVHPKSKKIFFFDNNWLAKDNSDLGADVKLIKACCKAGVTKVDFNQGLDARLMTPEKADIIKDIPIDPVRFAFDGMHEDKYWQNAVKLMADRGFKEFRSYVLFNHTDTPEDLYYRIREHTRISEELGVDAKAFPMRFQPILEVDNQRDYVGKHWTMQERSAFMSILGVGCSVTGLISVHSMPEFECWFGRDASEFKKLLNYPKIRELSQRKRANLRLKKHGRKPGEEVYQL